MRHMPHDTNGQQLYYQSNFMTLGVTNTFGIGKFNNIMRSMPMLHNGQDHYKCWHMTLGISVLNNIILYILKCEHMTLDMSMLN
jgi:hypothetical protein